MYDATGAHGIEELKRDIEYLEKELYHEYEVTSQGDHGNFGYRLARWIGCADSEQDQKALYAIFRHLFFIGAKEQKAAYRTAYSKHILQWLMKVGNADPFSGNSKNNLEEQLRQTRFTEITDSFGIREFCILNGIQGEHVRYRWDGNLVNWDSDWFLSEVLNHGQEHVGEKTNLVLLEDFVGSGSQMSDALELALSLGPHINILICPIFICPEGTRRCRELEARYDNLTFSPVLSFEPRFFISPEETEGEHPDFGALRETLLRLHPKVEGVDQEYGPFGFGSTGGFVVPFSNCPDNTLPVIHRRKENSWEPVFLRTSRLPI